MFLEIFFFFFFFKIFLEFFDPLLPSIALRSIGFNRIFDRRVHVIIFFFREINQDIEKSETKDKDINIGKNKQNKSTMAEAPNLHFNVNNECNNESKIHLQLISSFIGMNFFFFIMKRNWKKIFGNKEIFKCKSFFYQLCNGIFRHLNKGLVIFVIIRFKI